MNIENYIQDAIDFALDMCVQDEDFADTVNDQAMLIAGVNSDEIPERLSENH